MAALGPQPFNPSDMRLAVKLKTIKYIVRKLTPQSGSAAWDPLCEDGILRQTGSMEAVETLLRLCNDYYTSRSPETFLPDDIISIQGNIHRVSVHDWISALKAIYRTLYIPSHLMKRASIEDFTKGFQKRLDENELSNMLEALIRDGSQQTKEPVLQACCKSLLYLLILGQKIARRSKTNRMTSENIAIVYAPLIIQILNLGSDDPITIVAQNDSMKLVLKHIIVYGDFEYAASMNASARSASQAGDASPIDRRLVKLAKLKAETEEAERQLRAMTLAGAEQPVEPPRPRKLSISHLRTLRRTSRSRLQIDSLAASDVVAGWVDKTEKQKRLSLAAARAEARKPLDPSLGSSIRPLPKKTKDNQAAPECVRDDVIDDLLPSSSKTSNSKDEARKHVQPKYSRS